MSKEKNYEDEIRGKNLVDHGRNDHIFGSHKHPDHESVLSAKTTPVKPFIRAEGSYSRTDHK
jgi:hypothetical protein